MYNLDKWGLLLFLFTALMHLQPVNAAENQLKDITYATLPGNAVQITLTAESSVAQPQVFTTDNPARIAFDFHGMSNAVAKKTQPIGIGMVRSVTAIEAGGRTRVVVNLLNPVKHQMDIEGENVIITLASSSVGQVTQTTTRNPAIMAKPTATKMKAGRQVEHVDFRRGDAGEGRVMIQLSDDKAVIDVREERGRIVLDILDTVLPERFMRKFDVADFATPVRLFEVSPRANGVHVEIVTSGEFEHLAYQADQLFTVEFRALSKQEKELAQLRRKVFTGERLSLNFQDIEVRAVLQLLADFTGLNLVTSDTVGGRITLRLQNIPWDQALDIILKTRGLSMRKNGNVIMVAPTEEIAARERLELESQKQIEELAPLISEYIQINYAKASDIAALLKSEDNQLLTPERGNVTVDERTNTLLVRDTVAKLEDISRLVQKLDIPVRQVMIESRVVIANNNYMRDVGVRLGFSRSNSINNNEVLLSGGLPGTVEFNELDVGSFLGNNNSFIAAEENTPNLMVNLPASEPTSVANLLIGKVGSYLLQLELSAMQTEGKGEIISSPRLITSDKHKAVIKQGLEIPYQEASSSGATSVSFKEAVLMLDVTPSITPDDRIIMDIEVTKDVADFARLLPTGVGSSAPPVDTRSIQTSVLVDNGETVVLGGVFERTKSENSSKTPFLGDVPYLGFFFRQKLARDDNNELLFFLTPKILKETLAGVR